MQTTVGKMVVEYDQVMDDGNIEIEESGSR